MIRMGIAIPSLYHPERVRALYRCIESLYASQYVHPVICLSLHKYPRDIAERFMRFCHETRLVTGEEMTVSASRNRATAMALREDVDYIVHSDDDAVYDPLCLFEYYRVLRHCPRVGVVAPMGLAVFDYSMERDMREKGHWLRRTERILGISWAMRSDYMRKHRFLDRMVVSEDAYIQFGVYAAGQEVVRALRARVKHKHSELSGCGPLADRIPQRRIDDAIMKKKYGNLIVERRQNKNTVFPQYKVNTALVGSNFAVSFAEEPSIQKDMEDACA